tara:strand:- start:298 stop:1569 length:1272 start_codon:yes stop_codon:yes gene_type:complete
VDQIKCITLPNGVTVLYEHIEHIRSVLLGCWVKLGSREETTNLYGMAHFVEHMLFKGSSKRNAREIAESLEIVGGELNGFTSRENCCYYGKVTNDNLPLVCDVLSDLIFNPTLNHEEVELEKNVVCQEIDMVEDSLEEVAHETLVSIMVEESLGHPVVGTKQHVKSFDHEQVKNFHNHFYHPKNIFLTMVGNLNEHDFEAIALRDFGQFQGGNNPMSHLKDTKCSKPRRKLVRKSSEQMHLVMGWEAFSVQHELRYVLHLISAHLGGGMSSLLFQNLREELGLVYNVYSFIRAYRDVGIFGVYAGHAPDELEIVHERILSIIENLKNEGIEQTRLTQLKSQLKGNLLLGLEKTSFRMNRMGVGHLYFDRILSPDELINMVQSVTQSDIRSVAKQLFSQEPSVVAVGDVAEHEFVKFTQTGSKS